jgi:penicillin-binding protein 1A
MVLKKALLNSVNTIAAQLVEMVHPDVVIDIAKRCGITSPLKPVLSIALGTSGVSPLEMASAFSTFANGGIHHDPFWIRRVEDAQGRVLEEHIVSGKRVLDRGITYQVVDMMRGVLDRGTGAVVRRLGFNLPAAGKTGTTDGYVDAWFTGFTPTLSTAVWVGYDQMKSLKNARGVGITGGRGAAPIWADFMVKATAGEPRREFGIPDEIRFESVDDRTGCQAPEGAGNPIRIALRKNQTVCQTSFGEKEQTTPDLLLIPE